MMELSHALVVAEYDGRPELGQVAPQPDHLRVQLPSQHGPNGLDPDLAIVHVVILIQGWSWRLSFCVVHPSGHRIPDPAGLFADWHVQRVDLRHLFRYQRAYVWFGQLLGLQRTCL